MRACQWEDFSVRVTRAEARKRKMKRARVRGFVVVIVGLVVRRFGREVLLGLVYSMVGSVGCLMATLCKKETLAFAKWVHSKKHRVHFTQGVSWIQLVRHTWLRG
jgi:hypothetical protein